MGHARAGAGRRTLMGLRRLVAAAVLTAAATVGLLVSATPALAHTALQSSTPADGANLTTPPNQVVLQFTGALDPASAAVAVTGADGAAVADRDPRVEGVRVIQPLRPGLSDGRYTVTYRVTAADGHPINGALSFSVTAAPGVHQSPHGAHQSPHGTHQDPHGTHQDPHGTHQDAHGAHQDAHGALQQATTVPPSATDRGTQLTALAAAAGLGLTGAWLLLVWSRGNVWRGSHRNPRQLMSLVAARSRPSAGLVGAGLATAMAGLVAGLGYGGGASAAVLPGLSDPDTVTPWLLPATLLGMTVAAVATVGLLLAAVILSPVHGPVLRHRPAPTPSRRALSPAGHRRLRAAGLAAAGWSLAAMAALWLTLAHTRGLSPGESLSVPRLMEFATQTATGRGLAAVAVLAAALVVACRTVRGTAGALTVLVVAVAAVVPPVFTGHAVTGPYPQLATSGLLIHVVAATLWAGGLLALAVAVWAPVEQLAVAVNRFSPLAAGCFAAVGLSGVLSAWVHLPDLGSLTGAPYGRLILAKAAVLAATGAVGWWHRRRSMPALRHGSRLSFARLAGVEVLLFGTVFGTAMALSRTPPPHPSGPEHAGHVMPTDQPLLGYPVPPAPSTGSLVTWWLPEPVFVGAAAAAAGLYLAGVWRLRRRGGHWPAGRTMAWLAGCTVVVAATSTGLARYAPALLSAYLVRHLLLAVLAPILLVLAAPARLARHALPPAAEPAAWPGPRVWFDAAARWPVVRVVAHPVTVLAVSAGSFPVVYLSGLYETALRSPAVHLALLACAVGVGCLFFSVVIGAAPRGGRRPGARQRLVLVLATTVGYAVVGVVLVRSGTPIAPDWFAQLARPWAPNPLEDQHRAGGIVLFLGALPVLLAGVIALRQPARAHSAPAAPPPPAPRTTRRLSSDPTRA